MSETGWVRLYRKMLDNPIITKDGDYCAVWCYLMLNATHKEQKVDFNGKTITLKKGQLITSRKSIVKRFHLTESKVQRILKRFEIEQQIEQQTTSRYRLISIINWELYQQGEQPSEQPANSQRTASEHKQECKNVRMEEDIYIEVVHYLNKRTGKHFKHTTPATQRVISARLKEKFTVEDMKKVIDIKVAEWGKDEKYKQFLRPQTLFGTKFESYLNQEVNTNTNSEDYEDYEDWSL